MSKPPRMPAGSRRFWVSVLCFAIANAAAWVVYDRLIQPGRHHLLEVVQFQPGEGATVAPRPTLTWSFNLNVAPPTADNAAAPGTVSPPVSGRWQWKDARTLSFEPDADLPPATPFTLTLAADRLRTPDGFALARPFVCTWRTAPLAVRSAMQSAFDDADRLVVAMQFSDTVRPADALQHLTLTGPDGKPVKFHLHGEAAGQTVRVMTDPLGTLASHADASVTVRISAGLAGTSGPLGLADTYEQRLQISADLRAAEAYAYAPAQGEPTITVRFNNPVDADSLRQVISLDPPAAVSVTPQYESASLRGGLRPGTRYAIKIAKAPPHAGSKQFPEPTTLSVFVPDRTPGVWFEHTEGYLSAAGNRTVKAHAVNLQDLRVSVTHVYENNVVAWRNAGSRRGWRDAEAYSRPLANRDLHLPLEKNAQQNVTLSLDELLPADAQRDGVYRISLAARQHDDSRQRDDADPDESRWSRMESDASAVVTLSDIGLSAKQGRDGVTVWATSLRNATPLEHVRVRLYSNKNQPMGEAVSDLDGLARITTASAGPGERPSVLLAEYSPPATEAVAGVGSAAADTTRPGRGLTWLDLSSGAIGFGDAEVGGRPYLRSGYEAFIYTDRGVYRPGETVHLRAIVRGVDGAVPPAELPVRWQIRRPDLRNWKAQRAQIDADGAASFDLVLPADLPTGRWSAHVGLPDDGPAPRFFGNVSFQVEEFMPNRMKVALDIEGQAPTAMRLSAVDHPLVAQIHADYLFGRPVTERPAALVARVDAVPFAPPQWRGWSIGDDSINDSSIVNSAEGKPIGRRSELPAALLDDQGHAKWEVDLIDLIENGQTASDAPQRPRRHGVRRRAAGAVASMATDSKASAASYPGPWRLTLAGSVTETGGRAVSATRQVEVDLVPCYVAVRARQTGIRPGVQSDFEIALVKPDGSVAPEAATVEAELFRESWNDSVVFEEGRYRYQSTRLLEPASSAGPVKVALAGGRGVCPITPPASGSFVLRVKDPATGCITTCSFYAGEGYWEDTISRENPEKLELVVEPLVPAELRAAVNAWASNIPWTAARGWLEAIRPRRDAARVIVRSPFAGRLLLSVETDDVIATRVIEMPASHMVIPIVLPDGCRPNAYVTATVIRPVEPNAAWRTHRAVGVARLNSDESARRLGVEIALPTEVRPMQSLPVRLRVRDAAGRPVANAAITVAAVDEGICQLTGFATPDPFAYFSAARALGVHSADLYSQLMPETARPQKNGTVGGDGGDALGDARHRSPVSAARVRPVALYSGVIHTDGQGLGSADFPVPPFTGLLRVMAVASAQSASGSSDQSVFVRSPLLVQSSWPRFAAPGDRFTVPLLIFNNTTNAGEAKVALQWIDDGDKPGPIGFTSTRERRIDLAPLPVRAGGQATASVDVTVADRIGVARARLIADLDGEHYEETLELPVRPASPSILLGGYASAAPDKPCKVSMPGGMVEGTARYTVRISPWPVLELPQGLEYLDHYPYGCAEQTTSTLFPLVYLPDIGRQIAPGLFDKDRVANKVQVGITRLIGMQTADGGLAMWPGEREPWPWASVYAAHFLVEAKAAGYEVPDEFREHLLRYVRTLLTQAADGPENIETQTYACYVLALAGKPERAAMSRLGERLAAAGTVGDGINNEARFHLAAAWLAAGRRDLATWLIPQTPPPARADRRLTGNLASPIRERAVLLSTLLAVQPDHPALPELARQLASASREGRWRSTQDTAFAVMAIGRYLRTARSTVPYATAELLLDGRSVAKAEEGQPLVWEAPPDLTSVPDKLEMRITGAPDAIAHVAWTQTGVAPKPPADADNGLKVRRRYLNAQGNPLRDNVVRSGDLVLVELSVESAAPLEHVVIEDLLPAGLEIENPRLLTSAEQAKAKGHPQDDSHRIFQDSRLDIRDDRLIVVGHLDSSAPGTYLYTARAVAPGIFVTPAVRAECMYDIGTSSLFGGGGTLKVLAIDSARVVDTGRD